MVDLEKTRNGLICCANGNKCKECPYYLGKARCKARQMQKDAVDVFGSQEQKIKELTEENERLREKADRNLNNLKAVLEERSENMSRKELKECLWAIIRAEGIEVTNQNLDWLLERAYKEKENEQRKAD